MPRDPENYRLDIHLTPEQYRLFLLLCLGNRADFIRGLIQEKVESEGYVWPEGLRKYHQKGDKQDE